MIGPLFESMAAAADGSCAGYTTAELAVIYDFTVRAYRMAIEQTHQLRAAGAGPRRGKKG